MRRLVQTFSFREPERRAEFARRAKALLAGCTIVANTRLRKYAQNRLVLIAEGLDPADAYYVAAVVASKADMLWTRDAALLEAFPGLAFLVPTASTPSVP